MESFIKIYEYPSDTYKTNRRAPKRLLMIKSYVKGTLLMYLDVAKKKRK